MDPRRFETLCLKSFVISIWIFLFPSLLLKNEKLKSHLLDLLELDLLTLIFAQRWEQNSRAFASNSSCLYGPPRSSTSSAENQYSLKPYISISESDGMPGAEIPLKKCLRPSLANARQRFSASLPAVWRLNSVTS